MGFAWRHLGTIQHLEAWKIWEKIIKPESWKEVFIFVGGAQDNTIRIYTRHNNSQITNWIACVSGDAS